MKTNILIILVTCFMLLSFSQFRSEKTAPSNDDKYLCTVEPTSKDYKTNKPTGECTKRFTTSIDRLVYVQLKEYCSGYCSEGCESEAYNFTINGRRDEVEIEIPTEMRVCYRSRVGGYKWSRWTSSWCGSTHITNYGSR